MTEANYESKWWGAIYDQMMTQDLPDLLAAHRQFYHAQLADVSGPVLECACGTGLFLLPLLSAGHDAYGFDISESMLAVLKTKAEAQRIADIEARVSIQDFETFRYATPFDVIIIPSNSFVMLATQDAQIRTLRNIFAHLAPGGKLLLDLRLAGVRQLADDRLGWQGRWHTWTHPETGRPIRQRVDGRCDFDRQLVVDRCFIEYDGEREEFPMISRWIFRDEFQLLLRLASFERWEHLGTPEGDPLEIGPDGTHSYWIAHRP